MSSDVSQAKSSKKILSISIAILVVLSASAGGVFYYLKNRSSAPFGIRMGMNIDYIKGAKMVEPNIYVTLTPPNPMPLFQEYQILGNAKFGAVGVGATSKAYPAGDIDMLTQYIVLKDNLIEKYGAPADEEGGNLFEKNPLGTFTKWNGDNLELKKNKLSSIRICILIGDGRRQKIDMTYEFENMAEYDKFEKEEVLRKL